MAIRIDVSEIKTKKECGRKWQLSSRNAYHMKSKAPAPNLFFGSLFHECLHSLYIHGEKIYSTPGLLERIVAIAQKECAGDVVQQKVIKAMIEGYADQMLHGDLEKYKVLDIEHSFTMNLWETGVDPEDSGKSAVQLCGSIDLLLLEKATNRIWGMEHKTCKNFRSAVYNILDEQPKTYTFALAAYVDQLNAKEGTDKYKVGGIIVNEVKKVSTKFDCNRMICQYSQSSLANFWREIIQHAQEVQLCSAQMDREEISLAPCPGSIKCGMCDFAPVCEYIQGGDLDLGLVLDEFPEEFQVREHDHLDEKRERKIEEGLAP